MHELVKGCCGKELQSSADLRTSACCGAAMPFDAPAPGTKAWSRC